MTKHIVMYSGGVCSWSAAKRVVEEYGSSKTLLLFADTKIEDEDLYRFLHEGADVLKAELQIIADGRTPWEVFKDVKFLGNSRIDPCSRILKRDLIRDWIEDNYSYDECVIYMGMDWTEGHRLERTQKHWEPYIVKAPMMDKPYMMKEQMIRNVISAGMKPPRLYEMGFPHNNCGGFCIKAGHATFNLLLKSIPERYKYHEEQEQALQKSLGKNHTILKDRTNKTSDPLSLKEFRERIETKESGMFDLDDWGGCGCFVEN